MSRGDAKTPGSLMMSIAVGRVLVGIGVLCCAGSPYAETPQRLLARGGGAVPATEGTVLGNGVRVISAPPQYGYIDRDGKFLPLGIAKFVHLCRFREELAAVEIELPGDRSWGPGHWGFVDKKGHMVIPPRFQYAADFHDGLAAVNVGGHPHGGYDPLHAVPMVDQEGRHFIHPITGGKWGFVDKAGELVIEPIYDKVKDFSEGRAFVSIGRESGYINRDGQMVIKLPEGDMAGRFSHGLADFGETRNRTTTWGFLDVNGMKTIPARFASTDEFSQGRAAVSLTENGKIGYVDKSGAMVIEPQFNRGFRFSEGFTPVRVGDKMGFIDISGKTVVPPRYEMAFGFSEGLAPVRIGNQWGYIDTAGNSVISPRFFGAGLFRNGVARVAIAGLTSGRTDDRVAHGVWGFIDRTGRFVIPPQFDEALDFWEGMAVVKKYRNYGLADAKGNVIVAPRFDEIGVLNEGLVTVRQNGRSGFLDPVSGRVTIPLRFELADGFSCGRAAVHEGGKWGFIDKSGTYVIKPRYTMVSAFSEGLAAVCNDKEAWGYINPDGKMTIEPSFVSAGNFSEGFAAVSPHDEEEREEAEAGFLDTGKWGFIDKTGKFIIAPQYTYAEDFVNGRAIVFVGKRRYSIDTAGKRLKSANGNKY